jgi:hypothetical protein
MLGDDTFIRLVDELKSDFMQRPPVVEISKVKTFEDLAERIINGLKEEINPAA